MGDDEEDDDDSQNLVPESLVAPSLPLESREAESSKAIVYRYMYNSLDIIVSLIFKQHQMRTFLALLTKCQLCALQCLEPCP